MSISTIRQILNRHTIMQMCKLDSRLISHDFCNKRSNHLNVNGMIRDYLDGCNEVLIKGGKLITYDTDSIKSLGCYTHFGNVQGFNSSLQSDIFHPLLHFRTWDTNMRRRTYKSKKRKRYIRVGERILRVS